MHWRTARDHCRGLLRCAIRRGEDAVMPRRCVFCGTRCHGDEPLICLGCYGDLPWIKVSCARCGQPVAKALPDGVYCADCQLRPPPFVAAAVPLLYSFPVDAAIKAMKFRRRMYYAPAFGELLAKALPLLPASIDALLPVPLHWRRHAFRGFNQAVELSRFLQRTSGLPLLANVVRERATPYQSRLEARQRRRNLRSAFAVSGDIKAQHILIVDDVITTGETCRQLAETVLKNGAEQVSVVAIARAITRL